MWYAIVLGLLFVFFLLLVSITDDIRSIKTHLKNPSFHFKDQITTSICKKCHRPIYYDIRSKLWWAIDEDLSVTDSTCHHEPVGTL